VEQLLLVAIKNKQQQEQIQGFFAALRMTNVKKAMAKNRNNYVK